MKKSLANEKCLDCKEKRLLESQVQNIVVSKNLLTDSQCKSNKSGKVVVDDSKNHSMKKGGEVSVKACGVDSEYYQENDQDHNEETVEIIVQNEEQITGTLITQECNKSNSISNEKLDEDKIDTVVNKNKLEQSNEDSFNLVHDKIKDESNKMDLTEPPVNEDLETNEVIHQSEIIDECEKNQTNTDENEQ